jgi:hypothetical protein
MPQTANNRLFDSFSLGDLLGPVVMLIPTNEKDYLQSLSFSSNTLITFITFTLILDIPRYIYNPSIYGSLSPV